MAKRRPPPNDEVARYQLRRDYRGCGTGSPCDEEAMQKTTASPSGPTRSTWAAAMVYQRAPLPPAKSTGAVSAAAQLAVSSCICVTAAAVTHAGRPSGNGPPERVMLGTTSAGSGAAPPSEAAGDMTTKSTAARQQIPSRQRPYASPPPYPLVPTSSPATATASYDRAAAGRPRNPGSHGLRLQRFPGCHAQWHCH